MKRMAIGFLAACCVLAVLIYLAHLADARSAAQHLMSNGTSKPAQQHKDRVPEGFHCSRKATCVYYSLRIVGFIIRHETRAAARRILMFVVRAFFNDALTVAVGTSFHVAYQIEVEIS